MPWICEDEAYKAVGAGTFVSVDDFIAFVVVLIGAEPVLSQGREQGTEVVREDSHVVLRWKEDDGAV